MEVLFHVHLPIVVGRFVPRSIFFDTDPHSIGNNQDSFEFGAKFPNSGNGSPFKLRIITVSTLSIKKV